ncbi:hypothetical protein HHI36_016411 [Cryptolaemus montrouzieri]|uniref:Uncharacterized protein n=1 Tax=Cryptolaemus montrouzieri TaxID=559131 RepID=A0ABD2NKF6_9CUCU
MACVSEYVLVSHFSRSSPYGGSYIYALSDLDFDEVPMVKNFGVEGHFEVCCGISKKPNFVIFRIYRPLSRDIGIFIDSFYSSLNMIALFKDYRVVTCGDFNKEEEENWIFSQISLFLVVLSPKIKDYTHLVGSLRSLIDNVLVNFPSQCTGEVLPSSFSRHNAQMLTILRKPSKTKETATKDTEKNIMRIFSTSKLDYLRDQLRNMDWPEITNSKDVNRAYGGFLDRMKTLIDKMFIFKNKNICEAKEFSVPLEK